MAESFIGRAVDFEGIILVGRHHIEVAKRIYRACGKRQTKP
jgi:hypothetical protein